MAPLYLGNVVKGTLIPNNSLGSDNYIILNVI